MTRFADFIIHLVYTAKVLSGVPQGSVLFKRCVNSNFAVLRTSGLRGFVKVTELLFVGGDIVGPF